MHPLRARLPPTMLRSSLLARCPPRAMRPLASQRRLAHSGYGDGDGNPVSEQPQQQGPSRSADLEHPGPPPVAEGQGSGSSPTKGAEEGHNTSSSSSSDSSSSSGASASSGKTNGAQPKIHDERGGPPSSSQKDGGVEEHNRDFAQRHDRSAGQSEKDQESVGKGFWSGMLTFIRCEFV